MGKLGQAQFGLILMISLILLLPLVVSSNLVMVGIKEKKHLIISSRLNQFLSQFLVLNVNLVNAIFCLHLYYNLIFRLLGTIIVLLILLCLFSYVHLVFILCIFLAIIHIACVIVYECHDNIQSVD